MASRATLPAPVQEIPSQEILKSSRKTARVVPFPNREPATAPLPVRTSILADSWLETPRLSHPSRPAEIFVALVLHVALVAGPILLGLYYTDTLDFRAFTTTLLVAPPPPPPPPAAPAVSALKARSPKRVFIQAGKLLAPTYIPKQVAQLKEAPIEPDGLAGVMGGVPGGVPGGQLGGVIGGIISSSQSRVPIPTAPSVGPKTPMRVGGRIKPPRLVYQTTPNYPPIAKQTHIQGVVQIDAVIDTEGNVIEMQAVSGHPLLLQSALSAVSQWRYEPTYLNDQAIPVRLIVNVTFQLN